MLSSSNLFLFFLKFSFMSLSTAILLILLYDTGGWLMLVLLDFATTFWSVIWTCWAGWLPDGMLVVGGFCLSDSWLLFVFVYECEWVFLCRVLRAFAPDTLATAVLLFLPLLGYCLWLMPEFRPLLIWDWSASRSRPGERCLSNYFVLRK